MCNLVTFLSYFMLHTYLLSTILFQSSGKLVKPLNPMILLDVDCRIWPYDHEFWKKHVDGIIIISVICVFFFFFFACLLTTNLSSNLYDSGDIDVGIPKIASVLLSCCKSVSFVVQTTYNKQ